MLQLKGITKDYQAGTTTVQALKGIDLKFRDNEFVSILGPSGCGKTTLLNLLGGLDRYTTGDLIINGKSTKDFTDQDWDTYRNRRIGFVFQNYNLIPHQTVLRNVELALTLSGVSKAERYKRAVEVLTKVGLADQIHKRPNQLSGGQMQRVSIARALINNPDILLADEPTGALDSGTSEQIMEIIKEIAHERLVIMVTHNGELAEKYSTRIIKLFDGKLEGDNHPYQDIDEPVVPDKKKRKRKEGKTSMSFLTALSLSANNLLTKKARTFLTAFAGSIGIIGIALILSLSNGSQSYINKVQEDTLSTYPIIIEETSNDISSMISAMRQSQNRSREWEEADLVYSNNIMGSMLNAAVAGQEENDLTAFRQHLLDNKAEIDALTNAVAYSYDINLDIYNADVSNGIQKLNPFQMFGGSPGGMGGMSSMFGSSMDVWSEMIDNPALLESQYEVLAGRWPQAFNEVVLLVDENNELTDVVLYALGLKDAAEMDAMMNAMRDGTSFETADTQYTYDELLALNYRLVLSTDCYQQSDNAWVDMRDDEAYMRDLIANAVNISVVGILRPAEGVTMTSVTGAVGYLQSLTAYVIDRVNEAALVKAQKADPDTDVFTGKPFATEENQSETMDMDALSDEAKAYLATLTPAEQQALLAGYSATSDATYEGNLAALGVVDLDTPNAINLYPKDFAAKESLEAFINDYNQANADSDKTIHYTDLVGLMMSSVSSIINMISNILIAFVAISLVVSSIMIGIITYVSVLERTKEIGILKSIGASKKDISRVFNAETVIVGFVAGALGVLITALLIIPANMIIKAVTDVSNVAALPVAGAIVLIVLSMGLTFVAGLIPSRIAAKKDAVVALRTE